MSGRRLTAREVMERAETEAAFQAKVSMLFRRHGWLTYHTHDSRRSDEGFPDFVAISPPRADGGRTLVMRELKRQTGMLRPAQRAWLEALMDVGRVNFGEHGVDEMGVWRPSDWEEITDIARGQG